MFPEHIDTKKAFSNNNNKNLSLKPVSGLVTALQDLPYCKFHTHTISSSVEKILSKHYKNEQRNKAQTVKLLYMSPFSVVSFQHGQTIVLVLATC